MSSKLPLIVKPCNECGKPMTVNQAVLDRGRGKCCSRSCHARQKGRTHNHSYSPTYISWVHMRRRCNDPKFPKYERYGAVGIRVCDQWNNSFANFLADMGERPAGKTIDRIDSSRGYFPDNCKWSTPKEQSSHLRPYRRKEQVPFGLSSAN